LLAWSALLVLAALVTVGAGVTYTTWRTWIADVDRRLEQRAAVLAAAVQPAGDGAVDLALPSDAIVEPDLDYYAIWDAHGRLLISSDADAGGNRPPPGLRTIDARREHVQAVTGGVTLLVGRHIDALVADVRRLVTAIAGIGAVALLGVLGGGWWLIGHALTPVGRIGRTARAMIDGDLTARIPAGHVETELGQLADVLNDAFDRLYMSLERQRQFTADASHDLRTPLTTMQAETDWALARPRTPEEYQASLDVCRRAGARMQTLVQSLLELARAEASERPPRVECAVEPVIAAVLEDVRPLADTRQIRLSASTGSHIVVADAQLLRASIANLLTNAIQYNHDGGRVDVRVAVDETSGGRWIRIDVDDSGIGLTAEQAARVFDRFYRVDPARTARSGGAGLGLSVVSAFARTHGGAVTVDSTHGVGSCFTLRLPAQPH
jgi:signal transduction histidine kinase